MVQILGFNRPQNRAPQGRVFIDRDNWQANGLVFCAPLTGACLDPTDVSPRQIGVLAASGSAGYTIDGEMGPCATLNGSDQYFEGANPPSVTLPFSIMFWGKRGTGASGYGAFIGNNTTSSEMVALGGYVSPTFGCTLYHRSSSYTVLQTTTITVGAWHHYCGVVTSAELFAYLDASTQATHTGDAPYALPSGINRVTIGRLSDSSPGGYWPGEIRDVRIYDRVVSEAEIYALQEPPEKFALFCEPGVRKFIFLGSEVATSEATAVVAGVTAVAGDATWEKDTSATALVSAATAAAGNATADQNIHATALVSAATAAAGNATWAKDTSATALVAAGTASSADADGIVSDFDRDALVAGATAVAGDATAKNDITATAVVASATAAAQDAEGGQIVLTEYHATGIAPLCVYFRVEVEGSVGVTHPFHELKYDWDLDDEKFESWEHSGKEKNVAIGPDAAHVFEDAGSYAPVCTIRRYDDSGNEIVSWQRTASVTVTDTWSETYVFSNSGDFTDAPSNNGEITTSDWVTVSNYAATDRRLLLKRGDTYSCSATGSLSADGPGLVGAWGTGAAPILQPSTTGVDITRITRHDDWRITGLHFYGNSQSGCRGYVNTGVTYGSDHVLIYDCEFELLDCAVSTYDPYMTDMAVVGCTSTTPLNSQYYVAGGRGVFMGNTNDDQGYNSDGHCFRLYGGGYTHGAVIQHNKLWGNVSQHHAIKVHAADDASHTATQSRVIISDNDTSQANFWAIDIGPQSQSHDEHVWDVILERNICGGNRPIACEGATDTTIRNNIINSSGYAEHTPIYIESRERSGIETHDLDNVWVYNNTAYNVDSSSDFVFCTIYDYSDCVVQNNLASSPNDSAPVMVDDNGTNTTETTNRLTNTPGWVDSTPTDPGDYTLLTSSSAVDAGTYTHWCVDTYGGDNRLASPGPFGSSVDQGAWEFGADKSASAISAAGTAGANDATAELAVGFERTALVASGTAAAADATAVVDDFDRTATVASASAAAQDATAAKDISATALVAAGAAAAADAAAEKALTAAALVAAANAAANEVTWEKDTSALAVAAAATAAALDASSPSSVADVEATEDYHLLPPRPPTYPGLGDFTILRNFPKRRDHGYG